MAVDDYSRDALRRRWAEAWRRRREHLPLDMLDALIADVIGWHPEYQPLVEDPEVAARFEAGRSGGVTDTLRLDENPFLHMGLHVAVREQLAIDRPPGIVALHRALAARSTGPHDVEHVLMQSLAATLEEAQRNGQPPDEQRYLERVRRRLA